MSIPVMPVPLCARKYLFKISVNVTFIACSFWQPACLAFNPPIDEVGPLRVRIKGPAEVTARELPVELALVIENRGPTPIQGTWRIKVIDDWDVQPADAQLFTVRGGETVEEKFWVVPGPQTYPAHYPIHAFVRFTDAGCEFQAHPIVVVEAKVAPRYPPPMVPAWSPFFPHANSAIRLWELPVFRVVTLPVNKTAEVHPVGWTGTVEPHRANAQVNRITLDEITRESISMHPPWYQEQGGTVWWEIPLRLPEGTQVRLHFYAGINPVGQGDGVTFRVRVAPWDTPAGTPGEVLFEHHVTRKSWSPFSAELTPYAGKSILLQLEAHPGPNLNTGWDQAYWGEPILEVGDPKTARVSADKIVPEVLGKATIGGQSWEFVLWPRQRGWMDAVVAARAEAGKEIRFHGFQLRALGVRLDTPDSPFPLRAVEDESTAGLRQIRHRLETPYGPFDLLISAEVTHGGLRFRFWLENTPQPKPFWHVHLEDSAINLWEEPVWRVYLGHGNVVQRPGSFTLGFDGHRLATSFVGLEFVGDKCILQAVDVPPDDFRVEANGHHASLHTPHKVTMTLIPHTSAWEAVAIYRDTCGVQAASGVPLVAGRFVFDLWRGRYQESVGALQQAFRYGLTDAMVLWHNWQRWGYDYRLPEIFPPNPQLGTTEEMKLLIDTCRRHEVLFALHDNYIDFYPDAEHFSFRDRIAFTRAGQPVRAWFNEGRQAQSYRFRADQVAPFLRSNLQLIKEHLAPTAYFIDVWASIKPYDYWTADGRFVDRIYTRNSWGEHFAWIRDYLGNNAPQISESGHDQLIGWLDGATANHLRVGPPVGEGRYRWAVWNWPCEDAERIPWLDAAHHHRFILHGAGYSSRYQAGLDPRLHGIYSDDYITTEILTGRPAMVDAPFGYHVIRKYWLTQPIARALALQTIDRVTFFDDDIHRQIVTWSNGAKVWVNRSSSDWVVEGNILPPYGFLARLESSRGLIEASIARRDGVITEMSICPDWLYVNGRQPAGDIRAVRLEVKEVKIAPDGFVELPLRWVVEDPIPEGYRPFLHFCDQSGEIIFQAAIATEIRAPIQPGVVEAVARASVPKKMDPSEPFELRVGWYDPRTGHRLPLTGQDDGTQRIRIGRLRCEVRNGLLTTVSWEPINQDDYPGASRENPHRHPIDFGPIVTVGGCRIHPEGQRLIVTPLPGQGLRPWEIRVRWAALPWKLPVPTQVVPIALEGTPGKPQALEVKDQIVRLVCEPGVFAYELSRD